MSDDKSPEATSYDVSDDDVAAAKQAQDEGRPKRSSVDVNVTNVDVDTDPPKKRATGKSTREG